MKTVTDRPKNRDEKRRFRTDFVTLSVTSLIYHTPTENGARDDA